MSDKSLVCLVITLIALIFMIQNTSADISKDCIECGTVIYGCTESSADYAKMLACIYGLGTTCRKCGDDLCKGTTYKDNTCSVQGLTGDKLCNIYCKCHNKKEGHCSGKKCECMTLP